MRYGRHFQLDYRSAIEGVARQEVVLSWCEVFCHNPALCTSWNCWCHSHRKCLITWGRCTASVQTADRQIKYISPCSTSHLSLSLSPPLFVHFIKWLVFYKDCYAYQMKLFSVSLGCLVHGCVWLCAPSRKEWIKEALGFIFSIPKLTKKIHPSKIMSNNKCMFAHKPKHCLRVASKETT